MIELTEELRASLPEPDTQGIVRANVALRVEGDVVRVLEINDVPVKYSGKEKNDDENPMPPEDMPDLNALPPGF